MISNRPTPFIFVHIPKCAGTSIEKLLTATVTGRSDLWDLSEKERRKLWLPSKNNRQHSKLVHYSRRFKIDRYYKFAFVRNPWDRAVSQILYLKSQTGETIFSGENFKEHLRLYCQSSRNIAGHDLNASQVDYITDSSGALCVDFIGRFENLHKDLSSLCEHLGVQGPSTLPHSLNGNRAVHYSEFYDPESTMWIRNRFSRDIAYFGYEFNTAQEENISESNESYPPHPDFNSTIACRSTLPLKHHEQCDSPELRNSTNGAKYDQLLRVARLINELQGLSDYSTREKLHLLARIALMLSSNPANSKIIVLLDEKCSSLPVFFARLIGKLIPGFCVVILRSDVARQPKSEGTVSDNPHGDTGRLMELFQRDSFPIVHSISDAFDEKGSSLILLDGQTHHSQLAERFSLIDSWAEPGSLIAIHHYSSNFPEVKTVVDAILCYPDRFQAFAQSNDLILLQKQPRSKEGTVHPAHHQFRTLPFASVLSPSEISQSNPFTYRKTRGGNCRLGIVFLHDRVDSVVENNFRSIVKRNEDAIIQSMGSARPLPGGYSLDRTPYLKKMYSANPNSSKDILLYSWFLQKHETCEKWWIVDWATFCNISIRKYYDSVWRFPFVAANVHIRHRNPDWHWFKYSNDMPYRYRAFSMGAGPFVYLVDEEALSAISRMWVEEPFLAGNAELRFATIAHRCGFPPCAFTPPNDGISWVGVFPFTDQATIFYPVRHRVEA